MALMPWMYVLWAAAMLLDSVSYYVFHFEKLTWPESRTYLRNGQVACLPRSENYCNISHKDTGTYLREDIGPL